jgi:AhpD family alkylhydroperoxidase
MNARIDQPVRVLPNALTALQGVGAAIAEVGLPETTVLLVNARVSQINGCAVCLEGELREARKLDETLDRLVLVAAWRETPYYSPSERAALAVAEAVTRISDRPDPVPDDVWAAAAEHFDERQLAALVLQIASINLWNRLNIATAQQAGVHTW